MKPLSEYKVDFHYEDDEGCYHEDIESLLSSGILGFCGCGSPESNLEFIYTLLTLKEQKFKDEITYEEYNNKIKEYLQNNIDNITLFFLYFLDHKKITEHGSSVYGQWVKDENFFNALKEWYKEYQENQEGE